MLYIMAAYAVPFFLFFLFFPPIYADYAGSRLSLFQRFVASFVCSLLWPLLVVLAVLAILSD